MAAQLERFWSALAACAMGRPFSPSGTMIATAIAETFTQTDNLDALGLLAPCTGVYGAQVAEDE
jgi:hypothetical protein